MLLGVAISTFGMPAILGLSAWPTPVEFMVPGQRQPQFPLAMDEYSFPQMDWPGRIMEATQLREGRFPLWNAESSLGLPFAAQYQNQVFLPLEWLEIVSPPAVWSILHICKMVVAGFGAYLLLRRIIDSDVGALVGAVMYTLSAYFIFLFTVPAFVSGALFAPWLFWCVTRLRDNGNWLLSTGVTAFIVGLVLLSGQPQIALLTLLFSAIYVTVYGLLAGSIRRLVATLVLYGISVGVGVAIAAVPLSLFSEALAQGYTIHTPGAYANAETAPLNFTLPVWPFLLGQLNRPWDGSLYPGRLTWEAFPLLIGGSGLLLACLGLVAVGDVRRPRRLEREAGIVALLVVLLVAGAIVTPGVSKALGLWSMPVLNRVNFPRYVSPVLSVAVAGLVARGVGATERLSFWVLVVADALTVALSVLAARLVVPLFRNPNDGVNQALLRDSVWLGTVPFAVSVLVCNAILAWHLRGRARVRRVQVAVLVCVAAEFWFFVRYGFSSSDEIKRLFVFAALSVSSLFVLAGKPRWVAGAIVGVLGVTAVMLVRADSGPAVSADPFATRSGFAEFLASASRADGRGARVLATQGLLSPNTGAALGIQELGSLNPVQVGTTAEFILGNLAQKTANYITPNQWPGMAVDSSPGGFPSWDDYFERRQFYNLINVRYLVDSPGGVLSKRQVDGLRLVYEDGAAKVYEDTYSFPRAFALDRVRLAADEQAARRRVRPFVDQALFPPRESAVSTFPEVPQDDTGFVPLFLAIDPQSRESVEVWQAPDGKQYQRPRSDLDPRAELVVEARQGQIPDELVRNSEPHFQPLDVSSYTDDLVEVEAQLDRASVVVLSDSFYPGWYAYVDGVRQPVYRVDAVVRGVPVPAGTHHVEFRYEPESLGMAERVSLMGVLVCLASAVAGWLLRGRGLGVRRRVAGKGE